MTTSSKTNIIGIAGLPRSGKDTLAEVFMENGYFGVSLGDIVRNIARERHADKPDPISVANMTETANWLRQEHGSDFAMKKATSLFLDASSDTPYKGLVVYSVRAEVEVDYILNNDGALIWVDTSDDTRYRRYLQHMRTGEVPIPLKEQLAQEALQWRPQAGVDSKVQMHVEYVKQKSTHIFDNNTDDIEEFYKRAKNLLKSLN